jgi:hypothetical protein
MGRWFAILLPFAAGAAEGDFAPNDSAWNGLLEFCELARGMGMTVEVANDVDLDAVPARASTLVLFSPNRAPDPAVLVRFLQRGGRVLIADDYGDASPLLAALDIDRVLTPAVSPTERYRDNPNLPIARPVTDGPLVHGVDEVVANHPAYLRSRLPAVLGLDSPLDAIAVAGEVRGGGEIATGDPKATGDPNATGGPEASGAREVGRFVALSDPSVLINNMLAFPGNVAFARNLLTWLGRPGGQLVLLRHDFVLHDRGGRVEGHLRLADLHREFNAFVAGLSRHPPPREVLRALAALVALGVGVCLLLLLRLPRRAPTGPFGVRR